MHPHTERFGVKVSGVRNQAPCGKRADEHNVQGMLSNEDAAKVLAERGLPLIGGASPLATEEEIVAIRGEIEALDREADLKHEAAEDFVKQLKSDDKDPLRDKDLFEQVDGKYLEADTKRQEAESRRQTLARILEIDSKQRGSRKPDDNRPQTRQTSGDARPLGKRFTESDEFATIKRWAQARDGGAPPDHEAVEVLDREDMLEALRLRATLDLGSLVASDRQFFPPIDIPVRRPRVLDMIFVGRTDSDTIEYIEETTRTDAAAETPYGTAVPEANYVYTKKSTSVKRIGHFVTVTEGNLEDEGQTETLIEGRLMNGVERRIETQVVQGDAVGDNLRGILNTSGIGTQALGADTRLDALHKAITVVRINLEDDIDGIGLHPTDYQSVALGKDSTGQYLLGPANAPTSGSIWGYPTTATTAFPQGTPLVGRYKVGAVLWLRRGVSVKVTDAVNDDALKGLLKLIATARAAFAAWVPRAFCKVTGF